ncbi:MAG: hypothetical protein IJM25_07100 [Eubacterium sp.]|nr:hypothetical protein [Eubacterium sp.]
MKNAKKLVLAALMIAVMAFALCSCGDSTNYDGTYVVFESNGNSVEDAIKAYEAMGQTYTAEQICTMKLYDGSKFDLSVMGTTLGSGKYEVSGETMKLSDANDSGSSLDATYKDGVITIAINGQSMKLKKK